MISLAPAVSRPGWAACLSLAIGLTLAPATLPAQDGVDRRIMEATAAARTTLVIRPAMAVEVFSLRSQRKGAVTYGGAVDWLPQPPVGVSLAGFRSLDAGGTTLRSSFEAGGIFRLKEQLVAEDRDIFVSGRQTRDSVYTTYLEGRTVMRRYAAVRGGFTLSRLYQPGTTPSIGGTSRGVYVGVSTNQLANDPRGALGLKWIRTLAADLLVGSADSSAFGTGGGSLGFRGIWTTDFGSGSAISSRVEAGSQPGQGFFARWTLDFNVMVLDFLSLAPSRREGM